MTNTKNNVKSFSLLMLVGIIISNSIYVGRTKSVLAGTDYIFAGVSKDWFYGCDMEGANEEIKVWFSNDQDVVRMKVLFNAGVQVAFPNEVKIGKRQ